MSYSIENDYSINITTLEETRLANTPGFPFFTEETDNFKSPPTYPWHWHPSVQFFYVVSGEIKYTLPNGTYIFKKGHGGFINANILHMLHYAENQPCRFVYHVFHPEFIGGSLQSDIMTKYVRPITDNSDFDFFHLNGDNPSHKPILELLKETYEHYTAKDPYYELYIRSKISIMWIMFNEVTHNYRTNLIGKLSSDRIKAMLAYLNNHYMEKVTLEKIAQAGMCSKRECNRSFQNQLHTSPFDYLLQIRMQKACNYLVNTSSSITDISTACGFGGTSYFIKLFREKYGYSPKEYRKNFQTYSN